MLNIAVSTTSVDRIAPAGTRTSADMAMDKSAFWIYKGPAFEMLRMLLNGVLLRLFRICIERSMRSLLIPCLMPMVTVSITSILCTMFSSCQDYKNMISLRHGLQNGTQHFTPFLPLFWTQWNERRAESSKQISCRHLFPVSNLRLSAVKWETGYDMKRRYFFITIGIFHLWISCKVLKLAKLAVGLGDR